MPILNELQQFGKKILSWLWLFIAAFGFFFAFGVKEFEIFKKIQQDLLIKEMELIVTNPLDAVWAQIGISLFLAFVLTLPFLLYKLISFFSPALKTSEKKAILKALLPSVALFICGCIFAYYLLIPLTFKFLYPYVLAMGAKPFFAINQFISMVLILILGTGLLFLLPIFMILLSRFKIVSPDTWKKNWRYAVLASLVLTAIITPDGTGLTMMLLTLPMLLLYFLGWIGSKKLSKN